MPRRRAQRITEQAEPSTSSACPSSDAETLDEGRGADSGTTDEPLSQPAEPSSPAAPRCGGGTLRGRPRMLWSPELHKEFEAAVHKLGGPFSATPKCILEMMGTKGLSLTNVKSHLQKFRLKAHKRAQLQAAEAEATAVAVAGSPRPTKAGRAGGGVASTGSLPAGLSAAVLPNNMVPITTAGAVAAGQQGEVSFADPELAAQAAAWQRKRLGLVAAIQGALQACQSPTAHLSQHHEQAVVQWQLENLHCLHVLHSLHMMQMRQHLAAAACLKEKAQQAAANAPLPPEALQLVT
ncbi:hypothetical protein CHLNCDRAFT_141785 [Chlorella variabilis]|uniref:Myb-like domain-containing protein n=1 Tax=Chlorella variabilis TaxID=554065 RepID=E1ZTL4_CHLVA|nr:hypothetical protein CHLNCDRAFT_141785 [Chlorella variabilis]EFN50828.1 hypothetical protein CHLNCDRAFT_141785 [Chlorella variabilis]|eukprot:XP_005842930.1 hypothetical protein CHLNCDRAFT_141785 [Chlorella variabilis]